MNLWYALTISASMWLNGGIVQYDPLSGVDISHLMMTEISAEVGYGPMFFNTSILTTMFPKSGKLNFSPQDNTYIIGGGLRLKGLEIGIEHECWHPMIAYQWVSSRSQIIPNHEGAGTRIYASIKLGSGK